MYGWSGYTQAHTTENDGNRKGNFHLTYPQSQFHLSSQKPFQRHIK